MRSKKLATWTVLMAVAGLVAATAPASAATLTAPTGSKLSAGSALKGTNIGAVLVTNLTGELLYRCDNAEMGGEVVTPGSVTTTFNVTSFIFRGTGAGETCTSGFGTTMQWTFAIAGGLPYCIKTIAETDKWEWRGGKCSEATRSIKWTVDFSDGGRCGYEKAGLTGTFTTHSTGDAVLTSIKEGNSKRYEAEGGFSAFLCPSEAQLDMSFTLETEAGAAVYIS